MTKERKAMLEMLLCAVLWSIAGIFIKLIDWHPLIIAGFRSLFAAFTVGLYMLIKKQKFIINKKTIIASLFLLSAFMCFVGSNKLTTSANAIILEFSSPVFILIFSALFKKQKFSLLDIFAVILTLAGIAIFAVEGLESGHILGNIVGLGAGLFMAGMYISVGDCHGEEKMSGILCGHILTALVGLSFMIFYPPVFSVKASVSVLILGVIQLGIPYILLGKASEYCPPLACCLLSAAEPLLNPVWVAIFAKEYPSPLSIAGGVIVIATVTLWCIFKDRYKKA